MKKIILLSVIVGVYLCVNAQQQTMKSLSVGNKVPNLTFNNLINYPTKTANLSDFKGKLVILDFWATWCGACIRKFGLLDSVQKQYSDQIKVILVNELKRSKDNEVKINSTIKKWEADNNTVFSCILSSDSTIDFNNLFPHKSVPHYVWIDQKGCILAITSSEYVTQANIISVIKEEKSFFSSKHFILNSK